MPLLTPQTQAVLVALLEDRDGQRYGLEIAKHAGLPSGTIYPLLARLERSGWIESEWEQVQPSAAGRPRRRYYRLTGEGAQQARAELHETARRLRLVLPTLAPEGAY